MQYLLQQAHVLNIENVPGLMKYHETNRLIPTEICQHSEYRVILDHQPRTSYKELKVCLRHIVLGNPSSKHQDDLLCSEMQENHEVKNHQSSMDLIMPITL